MTYLPSVLLIAILGVAQAAGDEHMPEVKLVTELSPIAPVIFNSLIVHLNADTNPLAGLLNLRTIQTRQRTCPPSYDKCKMYQGNCCPTGGACCSSTRCCGSGEFCYSGGCCSINDFGCEQNSCCPKGNICCKGGGCCNTDHYCVTDSSGQSACCPNGQICTGSSGGSGQCPSSGYSPCKGEDFCCRM
ncbi:hypothetical protein PILCRDRAFT_264227 [Piloderma croceum F 1598]|uniref:Granulins domain-containing protein n=1 Tax=Piloderma croceum (strain F 1598) TaxID=765440 RepID=A0A0C3FU39_PILCF|nr:hypothetical protein PILCRDRAFT_264227 [Piloderma croceum F 1598]